MPFKSKSQQRFMFAAESRGELPKGTAKRWAEHTSDIKKLPEKVKKTASEIADEVFAELSPVTKTSSVNDVLAKIAAGVAAFTASPAVGRKELLKSFRKKPAPGLPTEQPKSIEWRKSMEQKPAGEPEMLKFFSLKESNMPGMPFSKGMPLEKPFMQQSPASAASRQLGGTGMAGSPAGGGGAGGGGGRVGMASVDPAVLEATLMKVESGPSKIWQGLTGLSDDILAAGMRVKEKADRRAQKHAAHQFAASVSMLTKMSDVTRPEIERFFRDSSALPKVAAEPDTIPGGKADGKPDKDFDSKQLAAGKKVEREHTNNPEKAKEIAKDHLEEIDDYYTRLQKMEDAAPKKEAGLLPMQQEEPVFLASPLTAVSPDILQLIRAQALIDQQKLAQPYDTGDVRVPYQREPEQPDVAEETQEQQFARQAAYERQLAEQMRAQRIEHEYTGKVRRGELAGGLGGIGAGAGLGYLLSKPGGRFTPMAIGGALGGLLGKGLGRHVGQRQGLDYLQQYTGVPWGVQ